LIKPIKKSPRVAWFVYILHCKDNTLYTGVCTDLERRLNEHNNCNKKGARYTRPRRPVTMVYREDCDDRSAACKREWAIKKLTRQQKVSLIGGDQT
jgi:putative endonuclease